MHCADFEELILDSFDQPLPESAAARLRGHLSQCGACRRFHEAQKALDTALSANIEAPELPLEFKQRVLRRVDGTLVEPRVSFLPEILDFVGIAGVAAAAGCLYRYLPEFSLPEGLPWGFESYALWALAGLCGAAGIWAAFRADSRREV
jgi:hypothetical protein